MIGSRLQIANTVALEHDIFLIKELQLRIRESRAQLNVESLQNPECYRQRSCCLALMEKVQFDALRRIIARFKSVFRSGRKHRKTLLRASDNMKASACCHHIILK